MSVKLLLVDDDPDLLYTLERYLQQSGYSTVTANNGKSAINIFEAEKPQAALIDVMMPELDGFEVVKKIRSVSSIPIILLTARSDETDKIVGLELGADDYVTKPFSPREVVARLKAIMRRGNQNQQELKSKIIIDEITVDKNTRSVMRGESEIQLTKTEFDILITLMESPGQVFTRDQIIDRVLGYTYEGFERTIDAHVRNLRKKIEPDSNNPTYIKTVFGVGYKIESSGK
ncbi:MAG: response regulator transcription factor [SAR202 cluster bacterium]|nr:response regulator transcription factor [SAR202 cluster bacterium]|tara:strand:- start:873 stop:1565 length:693 start_codon:yes stop_codon:yes gene_type:complete